MIFPMTSCRYENISVIKAIGLLSYVGVAVYAESLRTKIVASIVIIQGCLCHLTQIKHCMYWDVLCNVIFILWVTTTSKWQPQTFIIACVSVLSFMWSTGNDSIAGNLCHVFLVQGICAIAMMHW